MHFLYVLPTLAIIISGANAKHRSGNVPTASGWGRGVRGPAPKNHTKRVGKQLPTKMAQDHQSTAPEGPKIHKENT